MSNTTTTEAPQAEAKEQPKPKRPKYDQSVVEISKRARKLACPTTEQGPVAKQIVDVQRGLPEGAADAIKSVRLTRKELVAIAKGEADNDTRKKLRPLAERIEGAPQWTRGRPLAAVLVAWLEQK